MDKPNPLRYMNTAQIDFALQLSGYSDNKLAAVNYVGRQVREEGGNSFVRDHPEAADSDLPYVYEVCFYDDNNGRLTLGYVFVAASPVAGRAEFGTTNVTLEDAT